MSALLHKIFATVFIFLLCLVTADAGERCKVLSRGQRNIVLTDTQGATVMYGIWSESEKWTYHQGGFDFPQSVTCASCEKLGHSIDFVMSSADDFDEAEAAIAPYKIMSAIKEPTYLMLPVEAYEAAGFRGSIYQWKTVQVGRDPPQELTAVYATDGCGSYFISFRYPRRGAGVPPTQIAEFLADLKITRIKIESEADVHAFLSRTSRGDSRPEPVPSPVEIQRPEPEVRVPRFEHFRTALENVTENEEERRRREFAEFTSAIQATP